MRKITVVVGAAMTAGIPAATLAHPDHFTGETFGLAHFLTDPFHLLLIGAALVVSLAAWRVLRRREPSAE